MLYVVVELRTSELGLLSSNPIGLVPTDRPIQILEGEIIWIPEPGTRRSRAKVRIRQGKKVLFKAAHVFKTKGAEVKFVGPFDYSSHPVEVTTAGNIKGLAGQLIVRVTYQNSLEK
jgi:hypothetical protein